MHTDRMRWLVLLGMLAGCAELGVVSDGTAISVGKPSHGYLIEGVRLSDHGEGYVTREVWRARGNRFGTDELVDLVTAVARRMQVRVRDVKLVVADLSGKGGGERSAFHRSHQSGRDVDLLYYMRDAGGQPFEPDAMHVFDRAARATDGTGLTVDTPRTWTLVKELVTAPEAAVQWVFMYEPIARRLIEHAERIGEPEALIARARKTLKQPGDSARHDDHMHVRVYCSVADKAYGCMDFGPMELLAEHQAEPSPLAGLLGALTTSAPADAAQVARDRGVVDEASLASPAATTAVGATVAGGAATTAAGATAVAGAATTAAGAATTAAGAVTTAAGAATTAAAAALSAPQSLGRFLRTRTDRVHLRSWR